MGNMTSSVHNPRIFDNSRLCAQFERGDIPGMLLGDGGYPCRQYLMTPIRDPQTRPQRIYNVAQIRTRNTVERMFGTWKRLFPCLSTTIRTKLQTTLKAEMTLWMNQNIFRGFLLCSITVLFFFITRSSISATCCWV